jgi:hypothetical protein
MTHEKIHSELNTLLQVIMTGRSEIAQAHEKLQVAISGSLRLLTKESSTLEALKGDSGSLQTYLLTLSMQLKQAIDEYYDQLDSHTRKALTILEQDDRKS